MAISSLRSKDVSGFHLASSSRLENIYRYRAATVHGSHLRLNQFRIILVLGEIKLRRPPHRQTKSSNEQNHSTPLILIRDCYESVVLTSFFYLLLTYLSPNPDEQKEIFRVNGLSHENDRQRKRKGLKPQKWVFPLGSIKSRPAVSVSTQLLPVLFLNLFRQDGLYFLQIMKWAVLQYCIVRPAYVPLVLLSGCHSLKLSQNYLSSGDPRLRGPLL